jgi:hypothetical protein
MVGDGNGVIVALGVIVVFGVGTLVDVDTVVGMGAIVVTTSETGEETVGST